jgi:circadian clock protein KaiC
VSGFRVLEEGGLRALLDLLRKELRAQSANVVILDGFAAVGESAETDREFKKFVHELQVQAGLGACTFFLLSSGTSGEGSVQPVHTMVDGLMRLSDRVFGVRAQRDLQVLKFRGSRYLRGLHSFEISDEGLRVYPRLESSSAASGENGGLSRLAIGIPRLDAMIGGGLRITSTHDPWPGRRQDGRRLRFRVPAQGIALFFLLRTPGGPGGPNVGIDLAPRVTAATSTRLAIAGREHARRHRLAHPGVRRSARGQRPSSTASTRWRALVLSGAFLSSSRPWAVSCRLVESRRCMPPSAQICSPQIASPLRGLSPLIENMLLMRFVELRAQLRRTLSVIKLRDSEFDPAICEFCLTSHGLDVVDSLDGTEELMTGVAHETPPSRSRKPRSRRDRTKPKRRRG